VQAYSDTRPAHPAMRVRIDGDRVEMRFHHQWVKLGCQADCTRGCAGGWPGTLMTGRAMLESALAGRLRPEMLGCETVQEQGEMLVREIRSA